MGKQLVNKIGKSVKDQDACGDDLMLNGPKQRVDNNLRIPKIVQEKCSDYKPKKSKLAHSTIPSKQEVKEDLVKSEKKGSFITEETVKSNLKNSRFICFINMTLSCIFLLPINFNIKSVFLDKAARFSFTSSHHSTNYAASCPRLPSFETESCRSFNYGNSLSRPMYHDSLLVLYPGKNHQVFLNFRGDQLRYNFISHLSYAFQRHEIKFFIDKNEHRGKDLKHLLVRMEESETALAIFSTRYPESSWCMDELVKMKKLEDQGKLRVIPIFYKVEAEDVRKQKGEFGESFWNKAKTSSGNQIKEWKEALESISDKMGLSLGEKSSEADFVKEIVKEVQRVIEATRHEKE